MVGLQNIGFGTTCKNTSQYIYGVDFTFMKTACNHKQHILQTHTICSYTG